MSLAKVNSAAVIGLECEPVEVEVDISPGLPSFLIVGLPDKAVEESRERVRSAIKNSGAAFPTKRITLNLAPADLKKEGPSYDLPIAVGILLSSEQIDFEPKDVLFLGELSLNGEVRHTNGVLPIVDYAKHKGIKTVFLPQANIYEASLIKDIELIPVKNLKDLVFHFRNEKKLIPFKSNVEIENNDKEYEYDMAYIKGQDHVKRALEIAATGGHNIFMVGPPGSGKTLLARTVPSILPKMNFDEIIEATKIYSITGLLTRNFLVTQRPFRNPHHTASDIALVGGGQWPKPGEISLAHRGVLFLDEFPEFPRQVLEVLRQPLEDGVINIARATGTCSFPANFILIAAANPCPCGYFNDPKKDCSCSPSQVVKYRKKISGPLLDRIDIQIDVPRMSYEKLTNEKVAESSSEIRKRVQSGHEMQKQRFVGTKIKNNAEIGVKDINRYCMINEESKNLLRSAIDQLNLSARTYHRILKLARTIADLANSEKIETTHVAEAIQYKPKDQNEFI